ncbi:MAG: hypothetical protein FWG38_00465 [Defluviitaleaceae bacterium]|nr:hypothetical protein [Defluviitaleaceae bacterium]
MTEEEIRNLEQAVKGKADEIAQSAERKVEPFTRIVTLLGFVAASIFLLVTLVRGSYDGAVRLLFVQLEDTTIVYIALAVMLAITLWHLVSTIRFFTSRNKERKN